MCATAAVGGTAAAAMPRLPHAPALCSLRSLGWLALTSTLLERKASQVETLG